jgi:hypothetical protein
MISPTFMAAPAPDIGCRLSMEQLTNIDKHHLQFLRKARVISSAGALDARLRGHTTWWGRALAGRAPVSRSGLRTKLKAMAMMTSPPWSASRSIFTPSRR